jgi:hypothetical protein
MPGNALISSYLSGLRRRLPASLADEVSDGLLEAYQQHLASGQSADAAARAAVSETGDLAQVVGEFTRQAPGRRTARTLLAIGPVVGACWIASHAWSWPMPAAVRLGFGAALLVAPVLSWPLVIAVAASLSRMALTLTALPRITTA